MTFKSRGGSSYIFNKIDFFSVTYQDTPTMQTYIDYLPIDVIRMHIMPHLNYSERFGLNMCIPAIDRIPHRMKKDSIEKHDHILRVPIIKKYLDCCFWPFGAEQVQNMTLLFQLLQEPQYFSILERSSNFRAVVLTKIPQLIESLINFKEDIELGLRIKLASELKNLRNKIVGSGPYTDKKFDHIPLLSFT
jgi:hypothetical protein